MKLKIIKPKKQISELEFKLIKNRIMKYIRIAIGVLMTIMSIICIYYFAYISGVSPIELTGIILMALGTVAWITIIVLLLTWDI